MSRPMSAAITKRSPSLRAHSTDSLRSEPKDKMSHSRTSSEQATIDTNLSCEEIRDSTMTVAKVSTEKMQSMLVSFGEKLLTFDLEDSESRKALREKFLQIITALADLFLDSLKNKALEGKKSGRLLQVSEEEVKRAVHGDRVDGFEDSHNSTLNYMRHLVDLLIAEVTVRVNEKLRGSKIKGNRLILPEDSIYRIPKDKMNAMMARARAILRNPRGQGKMIQSGPGQASPDEYIPQVEFMDQQQPESRTGFRKDWSKCVELGEEDQVSLSNLSQDSAASIISLTEERLQSDSLNATERATTRGVYTEEQQEPMFIELQRAPQQTAPVKPSLERPTSRPYRSSAKSLSPSIEWSKDDCNALVCELLVSRIFKTSRRTKNIECMMDQATILSLSRSLLQQLTQQVSDWDIKIKPSKRSYQDVADSVYGDLCRGRNKMHVIHQALNSSDFTTEILQTIQVNLEVTPKKRTVSSVLRSAWKSICRCF